MGPVDVVAPLLLSVGLGLSLGLGLAFGLLAGGLLFLLLLGDGGCPGVTCCLLGRVGVLASGGRGLAGLAGGGEGVVGGAVCVVGRVLRLGGRGGGGVSVALGGVLGLGRLLGGLDGLVGCLAGLLGGLLGLVAVLGGLAGGLLGLVGVVVGVAGRLAGGGGVLGCGGCVLVGLGAAAAAGDHALDQRRVGGGELVLELGLYLADLVELVQQLGRTLQGDQRGGLDLRATAGEQLGGTDALVVGTGSELTVVQERAQVGHGAAERLDAARLHAGSMRR